MGGAVWHSLEVETGASTAYLQTVELDTMDEVRQHGVDDQMAVLKRPQGNRQPGFPPRLRRPNRLAYGLAAFEAPEASPRGPGAGYVVLGWESWGQALAAFAVAFAGGAINALAGGGTLLTFPALLWVGLPPVTANATNAVALWPSGLGGAWGFRRDIQKARRWWLWLTLPSLVGGALGAVLLVNLPSKIFAANAPFLVLAATALMALEQPIKSLLPRDSGHEQSVRRRGVAIVVAFVISVYGGYFGAGLGILILATLGLLGVRDIHQANGLKNLFSVAIKGIAVLYFVLAGAVVWQAAILMIVAATVGGYAAAAVGHRIGAGTMRWVVVIIGLGMAGAMFIQLLG